MILCLEATIIYPAEDWKSNSRVCVSKFTLWDNCVFGIQATARQRNLLLSNKRTLEETGNTGKYLLRYSSKPALSCTAVWENDKIFASLMVMKKLKILSGLAATQSLLLPWLRETSVSCIKSCVWTTKIIFHLFVDRHFPFPNTVKLPAFKISAA